MPLQTTLHINNFVAYCDFQSFFLQLRICSRLSSYLLFYIWSSYGIQGYTLYVGPRWIYSAPMMHCVRARSRTGLEFVNQAETALALMDTNLVKQISADQQTPRGITRARQIRVPSTLMLLNRGSKLHLLSFVTMKPSTFLVARRERERGLPPMSTHTTHPPVTLFANIINFNRPCLSH